MIDASALSLNPRFTPLVESSTQDLLAPPQGEKFLRFVAGDLEKGQVLLLPALEVMEVVIVTTTAILPVPQLPAYVLGVYQWRGKSIWTVDLGQLLGLAPLAWPLSPTEKGSSYGYGVGQGSGHFVLVLELGNALMGLAVSQVEDIVSYDLGRMQPPEQHLLTNNLRAFTKGVFSQPNHEIHLLLNSEYLLHSEIYVRVAA
ncbi:MAG: chemotaxis protein CheW [Pseudanabaena sp. ELA607]